MRDHLTRREARHVLRRIVHHFFHLTFRGGVYHAGGRINSTTLFRALWRLHVLCPELTPDDEDGAISDALRGK
ncbi:MAG TPA: hypothetical protein DDW36_02630 [Candidatus Magasanikbacteria bacterium]|nr:hypothetical protein [Candidatus Magasanikbacteria bacterium]